MRFGIFLLAALAWLGTPAYLILRQEETLAKGHVFKFKAAPIDPVDALRGRYVALSFDAQTVGRDLLDPAGSLVTAAQKHPVPLYATFVEDAAGYAAVASLSDRKPSDPAAVFLPVSFHHGWGKLPWQIALPFDRFYMEEQAAPRADAVYRQNRGVGQRRDVYALVAIYRGNAAIRDLCIEGVPIRDYLQAHPAAQ